MLGLAETAALIERCAPGVAAPTLLAIIEVESGFDPLSIGVNGPPPRVVKAADKADAVAKASGLIAAGLSIDLGLGQINSRNLEPLAVSVEDAFDPCQNLAAAAGLLRQGYDRALASGEPPQAALRTALSVYNTGHPRRGLRNGYVAKVLAAAERLQSPGEDAPLATPGPPIAPWDIFARARQPAPARFMLTFPLEVAP